MAREKFEQELQRLREDILTLGAMAERAVAESVQALKRRDRAWAQRLMDNDRLINEKRYSIENDTLTIIATQQPMAGDLRSLAAVFEIATELERIADYAKGAAHVTLLLSEGPLVKPLEDIPRMADKVCDMLHRALDAFMQQDVNEARRIPPEDDEVDMLYSRTFRELITITISNSQTTEQANLLARVAHNLERAADRVGNICERVVFSVTGRGEELDGTLPRWTNE